MFLVVDNTRRKIRKEIQFNFNAMNIPCVIADLDHCAEYMPAALIIVTEKYLLDDVKYLSKMYDDTPVALWDGITDFCSFACKSYKDIYGLEVLNCSKGRLKLQNGKVFFGERRIFLTKTEFKILLYLFYTPGWHHKEHIAKYCLNNGKKDMAAVPVHICNINTKFERLAYTRIILFKRYVGYSM